MNEDRRIPETEFAADLAEGLAELSTAIKASGLTIAAIARGTRCHWETVYHAANGIPVRYENARRIALFVEKVNSKLLP